VQESRFSLVARRLREISRIHWNRIGLLDRKERAVRPRYSSFRGAGAVVDILFHRECAPVVGQCQRSQSGFSRQRRNPHADLFLLRGLCDGREK